MSRSLRRWIARLMIGIVLFGQFAITAHACGTTAGAALAAAALLLHDGVPCPDALPEPLVDEAATPLCVEHCQPEARSADYTPAPPVLPALLSALYTLPPADGGPPGNVGARPPPRPGAAPPLSILHCCLRD